MWYVRQKKGSDQPAHMPIFMLFSRYSLSGKVAVITWSAQSAIQAFVTDVAIVLSI